MSTIIKSPPIPATPTKTAVADHLPWFDGAVELQEEEAASAAPPPTPAAIPTPPVATVATPSPPPSPTSPPHLLNHRQTKPLRDDGEIGRGAMGSIRKLYDPALRRSIAVKVLEPSSAKNAEQRFIDEARIIGLLDHPNIVPVHDLVVEDGNLSYTMKLVSGATLSDLISEQKTVRDLEHILNCLIKVCDALSFAHSRGVIHRDLKPDNIMIGGHGQVYVMDWGCAQVLADTSSVIDGRQDSDGMVIGTLAYMAPEQALGLISEIDGRTDIFAVGAMLYKVLTGSAPYLGPMMEILIRAQKGEIKPPTEFSGNSIKPPPQLSEIAMKAMSKEPQDRFQTIDDLAEELRTFLRGGNWFPLQVFPAGAVIVREGDPANEAYIITKGTCEVRQIGSDAVLRTLGEKDVFGETAIFAGAPRSASVIATSEVSAVVVDRSAIEHMTGTSWLGMFVKALADRFLDIDAQLAKTR